MIASSANQQAHCCQSTEFASGAGKPAKWEYLESKRPHTHEARFLAVVPSPSSGPLLISGGNDAQLFAYRIPAFTKVSPPSV